MTRDDILYMIYKSMKLARDRELNNVECMQQAKNMLSLFEDEYEIMNLSQYDKDV